MLSIRSHELVIAKNDECFNLTTVVIFRNRTSFDIVVLQTGSINFNIYLKTKQRPERMEKNSKDLILMNTFFANSFFERRSFSN